jgi:threonine synthase
MFRLTRERSGGEAGRMMFVSTRGKSPPVSLSEAIAAGLAPDGGLFVPAALPMVDLDAFDGTTSLAEIAATLLTPFFETDELLDALDVICREAFTFDAPLRPLGTPDDFVLELFHGPTAAFKDFGARFLAACMRRLPRSDSKPLTIVVATSGDTGAAVAAAFHRVAGFRVVILYPDGRVSPRQAHQLGCFGDNVRAFRVDGSFDDCQRMAKHALGDAALQADVPMTSANSISLGRLLPQMVYYAHAALAHRRAKSTHLNFVVPTGNLGNALACILTRAIGLPIGRIALATNANRTLHDFFAGADYAPRAGVATLANAMDVGAPSNFERLRWLYPDAAPLRQAFTVDRVDDGAIETIIRHRYASFGEILCPHTATAVHALERLRRDGAPGDWAVVSSAHPAKFERVVEPLIDREVPIPAPLAALLARPSAADPLPARDESLAAALRAEVSG